MSLLYCIVQIMIKINIYDIVTKKRKIVAGSLIWYPVPLFWNSIFDYDEK